VGTNPLPVQRIYNNQIALVVESRETGFNFNKQLVPATTADITQMNVGGQSLAAIRRLAERGKRA